MSATTTSNTSKQRGVAAVFARQKLAPLTIFGVVFLLLSGIGGITGASFIGLPNGIPLATTGVVSILGALLMLSGIRWAPFAGAIISGTSFYYAIFVSGYPKYHFQHPQELFVVFVSSFLGVVEMAVACVASLAAGIQNYRSASRAWPAWFSLVLTGAVGFASGAILFAAIVQPAPGANTTSAIADYTKPTVQLGAGTFLTPAVTIPRGASLTIVNDTSILHILDFGAWVNNQAQTSQTPAGAPALHDAHLQGEGASVTIGPFTAPGVYHILCTVHPGMEMTVTVA